MQVFLDFFEVKLDVKFYMQSGKEEEGKKEQKRGQKRAEINEKKREKRGSEEQIVGCKKVRNGAAS